VSIDTSLEELVTLVCQGRKYATVHRGLVRRIVAEELVAGRSPRETVKAVRRRLHQVGAAYVNVVPRYDRWLTLLRDAAASGDIDQIKDACRTIMAGHQSSRERLDILDRFYRDLLGSIGPIGSVLDLASGLNPLAVPWMSLALGARYSARDVFADQMAFLAQALSLLGVQADAQCSDVLAEIPGPAADVALVLKAVPCLEQLEREAGDRLVALAPARYVVVSFPTASLGGRKDRGMLSTYRTRMARLREGQPWTVREYLYDSELAYLVDKAGAPLKGAGT